jgi:trehalose-6-phosphatase
MSLTMKVTALFSDYDGTLAPDDVPRELSRPRNDVMDALLSVSRLAPLLIVTSKDCKFAADRVPFASGWACVCGAELHTADGWRRVARVGRGIELALGSIRQMLNEPVVVEEKRGCRGELLGFSVDFRGAGGGNVPELEEVVSIASRSAFVVRMPSSPYVDFFASRPDKGKAVRRLKRRLGIEGGVLYMGDSPLDNSAFREADISVCVTHGQPTGGVEAEYSVELVDVAPFLLSLVRSGMNFSPGSTCVRTKGGAV